MPISPHPAWLRRVKLIAASLRQWYPSSAVTISCYPPPSDNDMAWLSAQGDFSTDEDLYALWRNPTDAEFSRWSGTRAEYLATMMERYRGPFEGDYILMLDADVIPVKRFDEWFSEKSLCGVQAHIPPISVLDWCQLFRSFGLPPPDMRHEYSGYGVMTSERFGPLYYNSGVVFGRRELFEKLEGPYFEAIEHLRAHVADSYWFDQLGLALGIAAAGLPARTFPLKFNFPNRGNFDRAFPVELADVRFLHAMQTDVVHRDRDFESDEALATLVARKDLDGSNEVLRRRVAELRA